MKSILWICILALVLAGCGTQPEKPSTSPTLAPVVLPDAPTEAAVETDPDLLQEHLAVKMEAGELYLLNSYPNLKSVDLSGSTCYESILDYAAKHPAVAVTFTVDLGGTAVAHDAASAALNAGGYTYEALEENLQYLESLTALTLNGMDLSAEQMTALRERYPEIVISYTVEIFGENYDLTTTELDLSSHSAPELTQVVPKLGLLSALERVKLSGSLTYEEVDALQTLAPTVVFDYSFTIFGKTISTADEEVYFEKHSIGDDGEEELRSVLELMEHCDRFVLDNCKLSNEVLAGLREEFRETGPKVVWRIWFGKGNRYTTLTDDDTIDAVENVTDDTCGSMKYLEDVKYMDIGHNDTLTDISFLSYMPNIEVVIASGSAITALPDLSNCQKLTWLELAYCGKLTDISGIANCKGLRFLNLSYTKVSSYADLDTLPLERFMCLSPKASASEQETFQKIHPKSTCLTVFYGTTNPYGYGWRYDDNGKTFNEYYKTVLWEAFDYGRKWQILNAQNSK